MMKLQLLLPLTIMASVTMVLILKTRKRAEDREDRRYRFENIRLRVTIDVLTEHQNEKATLQQQYDNAKEEESSLRETSSVFQSNVLENMGKLDTCHQDKRQIKTQLDTDEKTFSTLTADVKTEKDIWLAEMESLKKIRGSKSPVCSFLKPNSDQERIYCKDVFIVEPRPVEPKAPEPKLEESKAPKPKAPEPKAPVAKAPVAKAPVAKAPEPKAADPKAAAPKAAGPIAAEPKAEEPNLGLEDPKKPAPRARRRGRPVRRG